MEFKEKVVGLLDDFFKVRDDLFLLHLKISPSYDVVVIIDGDNGVSIQDCLDTSRAVENHLDREEQDFSLQVMSAGITEPLILPRQYQKNVGRFLEITQIDDKKINGKLLSVEQDFIIIEFKYKKNKEVGKGKIEVTEQVKIPFSEIKKAVIEIKF